MNKELAVEHAEIIESLNDIKKHGEFMSTIAHEDLASVLVSIKQYFTKFIPNVAKAFAENADRLTKFDKDHYNSFIRQIYEIETDIKKIAEVPYSSVMDVKVPVMLGMKQNLLTTASELKKASTVINDNLRVLLEYTDIFISLVLSNEDFRTASRVNYAMLYQRYREDHKGNPLTADKIYGITYELEAIVDKLIDPKNHSDQRFIKELVPNINSLYFVQADILEAAKGTTFADTENIQTEVTKLSERADVLYDVITTDTEFKINKALINELAGVLEDSGRAITSAVTLWHIMNQTATTLKFTVDTIKRFK